MTITTIAFRVCVGGYLELLPCKLGQIIQLLFRNMSLLASVKEWDWIVGYLTSQEAYHLCVGYHFQVIIYTHEDEVI